MGKRMLVVQVAALGYEFFIRCNGGDEWKGLNFRKSESIFPALTCPVQATVRTGTPPSQHGMVMNGVYLKGLRRPFFWDQSSNLVEGKRIWHDMQASGGTVGMLFWQQSLGEEVDVILSPAPVHKHGGGIVEDVYSRPECFYNELVKRTGQRFRLSSYWGPFASIKSSEWITAATAEIMSMKDIAPDLLLTYLPHLDYTLQKYGCEAGESKKAFRELMRMLERLVDEAAANGYEVVIFGDYAIGDVNRVVFPNKSLIQKGLLKLRPVGKRLYPDYYYSRAFAVADHEIAHVYVRDKETTEKAIELFNGLDGIHEVLTAGGLEEKGLSHPNTGDIVLVAAHGAWFAYPWWDKGSEAPDYAAHVDIHNKPGYDPCELFLGWHPFIVSADTNKVKGSHGRTGPGREIALAASFKLDNPPHGLPQLSSTIKHFLEVE